MLEDQDGGDGVEDEDGGEQQLLDAEQAGRQGRLQDGCQVVDHDQESQVHH